MIRMCSAASRILTVTCEIKTSNYLIQQEVGEYANACVGWLTPNCYCKPLCKCFRLPFWWQNVFFLSRHHVFVTKKWKELIAVTSVFLSRKLKFSRVAPDPDLCLHLIHQDGVPRPLPLAMREIEKASFGRGWERVWRFETGVSHQVCHRSHRFLSNMNIILDISEYQKPRKFRLISEILPELRHR